MTDVCDKELSYEELERVLYGFPCQLYWTLDYLRSMHPELGIEMPDQQALAAFLVQIDKIFKDHPESKAQQEYFAQFSA